jgi:hypothetical protein
METRPTIMTLVDYEAFFETSGASLNAAEIIENISSKTLLNYISGFAVNCYLNDNIDSGLIQGKIINSLVSKASTDLQLKWRNFLNRFTQAGHAPVLIWSFSNLLFYDLMFSNWNDLPMKDLSPSEAELVFQAYLLVNSISNAKIQADELEAHKQDNQFIEEYIIPQFLPQRDYSSTSDYSNQIIRGAMLFEWLESDPKFSVAMPGFYKLSRISGWKLMFKNLMTVFVEIGIDKKGYQRNQLIELWNYRPRDIAISYLKTLAINQHITAYKPDVSFGLIRKHPIYALDDYNYFVLDVNFLIDHFYKAQIFALNAHFSAEGIDKEFLSTKGKRFMEDIYLRKLMDRCFPKYVKYYGDQAVNSSGEELSDFYIREGGKICLMEFKDVMLNAAAKNSADSTKLYDAVDTKFKKNQKGKPKGISQLINAIIDIDKAGVSFDHIVPESKLEVYPVILYTDHTFGVDSLNYRYNRDYSNEVIKLKLLHVAAKPLTFINLNTFELQEGVFTKDNVNLFSALEAFHDHIKKENYENTPFEVFFRFYLNHHKIPLAGNSPEFKKISKLITDYVEVI